MTSESPLTLTADKSPWGMTERLIEAAIYLSESKGAYRGGAENEVDYARQAIEAQLGDPVRQAAPDLLNALRLFIKQWNACGPTSDFGRYFSNVRDAANTAIAKAEAASIK